VSSTQTAMVGNHSREEEYDLFVSFLVAQGGYDSEALDTRVFALFSALELALRADPQLSAYNGGQPIGQPFQITDWDYDLSYFPTDDAGGAAELVVTLACQARLRLT
jgi:hypothetical protein